VQLKDALKLLSERCEVTFDVSALPSKEEAKLQLRKSLNLSDTDSPLCSKAAAFWKSYLYLTLAAELVKSDELPNVPLPDMNSRDLSEFMAMIEVYAYRVLYISYRKANPAVANTPITVAIAEI
jgi:hypothetical protein